VREAQLVCQPEAAPLPYSDAGRGPLADTVESEDRRFFERRREERTGCVRLVMLGEQQPAGKAAVEPAAYRARHVQLLSQPAWNDIDKGAETNWCKREIGFQQPLELKQRLVVEADVVKIFGLKTRRMQAVVNRLLREAGVVLAAAESLLFGGRDDLAIDDERRRRVVIER
jgi:hypothetical protein